MNNGLARTPPMGFNTWNQFGHYPNETLIKLTIDNMVKLGLRDLGYKYIVIDDCWALKERDPKTKRMIENPNYFPSGMTHLAEYAHSAGMMLGIYSDVGKATCQGLPGSLGYYEVDAQTFAEWKIDYLKLDFCATTHDQQVNPAKYYQIMSDALNDTGRPIVYSICNWGSQKPWIWAPKMSNLWRTTADIHANWPEVMRNTDINKKLYQHAAPGAWNDPDLLVVGINQRGAMINEVQSRSHFSLWSIMNSPLMLGNDFRDLKHIEPWVLNIIMNRDVILVNQDPLGIQGIVVDETHSGVNMTSGKCTTNRCSRTEIWAKPMADDALQYFFSTELE